MTAEEMKAQVAARRASEQTTPTENQYRDETHVTPPKNDFVSASVIERIKSLDDFREMACVAIDQMRIDIMTLSEIVAKMNDADPTALSEESLTNEG